MNIAFSILVVICAFLQFSYTRSFQYTAVTAALGTIMALTGNAIVEVFALRTTTNIYIVGFLLYLLAVLFIALAYAHRNRIQ